MATAITIAEYHYLTQIEVSSTKSLHIVIVLQSLYSTMQNITYLFEAIEESKQPYIYDEYSEYYNAIIPGPNDSSLHFDYQGKPIHDELQIINVIFI